MYFWLILLTTNALAVHVLFAHQHGGQHDYDVIILGAGLAGIGVAKELTNQNISNFTILEGNDYIGGRIKNMDFNGTSIPVGAGWIHASEENHVIYRWAKKYNLTLFRDRYDFSKVIVWNRKMRTIYPSSDVVKEFNNLKGKFDKMDTNVENRIKSGGSDMDLETALRSVGWHPNTVLKSAVDYYMFDFENGIPPNVISATSYGYTGSGKDYIVNDPRGFNYPMLQEIQPFENKILLNQTVTRIKRNADKNYTIYTDNSKEWTAKYVIVTFSSGVLNSDIVKFEPDLPDWKKESLALVPMCYYCKIFAQFSEKFWNDTIYFLIGSEVRGYYFHWQDASDIFNISNTLIATLTGDTCKSNHIYNDIQIADHIYDVLKDIYPGASRPIGIIRNTFNNDPKFMGAYSYQTPGINKNDYEALDHPVQQGLWFAGEYLQRDEYGYAHGAYANGVKVAKSLVKCMQNGECPADTPKVEALCKTNPNSAVNRNPSFYQILLPIFSFIFLMELIF